MPFIIPSAFPSMDSSSMATIGILALIMMMSSLFFAREVLRTRSAQDLRSPLKTSLHQLSPEETSKLAYQTDHFPGGRDVETPYGSIRAYEFGPEDGVKVILIHGLTTPCIALSYLARGLVKRGCRVILFDLFGRGFSDGVGDIPHDARLYVTQILHVLASSSIPWTGDMSIRIIGYSFGGAIAAHFAATFPHMVTSLVMIAPSGLIRPERLGRIPRFVYFSGVIPERILHGLTKRLLQQPMPTATEPQKPKIHIRGDGGSPPEVSNAAEVGDDRIKGSCIDNSSTISLLERVSQYTRWMADHHQGFVPSFMSCMRHAPLMHQHAIWKVLAQRKPATTAVLLADQDAIINKEEYEQDGLPLLGGREHVHWKVLPGTHDFVMTHAENILHELDELWDMQTLVN